MADTRRPKPIRRLLAAIRTEWAELSGLGRTAFVGIVLSAALAVVLGFFIPQAARAHLLDARTDSLEGVAADLASRGLIPLGEQGGDLDQLDDAVQLRLLGGDTVRVKLWSPAGTIVYSDVPQLVGQSFPLGAEAEGALAGESAVSLADMSADENVFERGFGDLLEFYIPVSDDSGQVVGLFEVYQRSSSLDASLDSIRRNVWLSIGVGLGLLSVFMGSLTIANARSINRQRRRAEKLLAAAMRAREEERARIVGALHDDIGQPLYRVLYGLRSAREGGASAGDLASELESLEGLVLDVDRSLRTELRTLRDGLSDELDLPSALEGLVETTRLESDIDVDLELNGPVTSVDASLRAALFRAAQEALINARKHSGATRATVRLRQAAGRVLVEVVDSGVGWPGIEGLGLATTRERLEVVGGGLEVTSNRHGGTSVTAWVPGGDPS